MRKFSCAYFLAFLVLLSCPVAGSGQDSAADLRQFQRNLMDSFIGRLNADGKEVTPRERAMFMGYILNRQAQSVGEFETDKARMSSLVAEVKEFLGTVSAGENLWPVVEAGLRGEFRQEVDALLGGSAYVTPIFPSLNDMVRDWQKWDYRAERFNGHPDNPAILNSALTFLQLLKEKRYPEIFALAGGRCHKQFTLLFSEMAQSTETREKYDRYFENLEWKAGAAGLTDSDPPMARIMFSLRDPDGDWEEDPCILIRDAGTWKVARFID